MDQKNIRNFCIIAHIDHGKSTLADRFLEMTHTVEKRLMRAQTLDSMELEQEKGITIKLKAVRMNYEHGGQSYQLNLIDTPGHVDFSYEVSRSLAACEGAILVVDVTQGIEAQTVSNVYKALDAGLTIIPVLNKIDISGADCEKVVKDMTETFGFKEEDIIKVSAKTGEGLDALFAQLIEKVSGPQGDAVALSRALVFDTFYDEYLGVVAAVRVVDGSFVFSESLQVKFLATSTTTTVQEMGIFTPQRRKTDRINTGEVGYVATGLKDIQAVKVGDTLTCDVESDVTPLPGYKEVKPFVFVSIFPIENDRYPDLREALEKLSLSDSALQFEPESSTALGFGFRCGFLGLLHADIVQERLEREYNLELISTTPTVEYKVILTNNSQELVKRPADLPNPSHIQQILEPWIRLNIVSPTAYVGNIITLCEDRRGVMKKMEYPSESKVIFEYELPLSELIHNFFDELKTVSSGFASLDYDFSEYRSVEAIRLDILVHEKIVEPFSQIVIRKKAVDTGKNLINKLKDVIPRQQFKVALQAAIGGKIIAREDIPALRKNVLAKMSGGHRERKDKLLDIQKKGKKRMKKLGSVDIPQEAFREVLQSS